MDNSNFIVSQIEDAVSALANSEPVEPEYTYKGFMYTFIPDIDFSAAGKTRFYHLATFLGDQDLQQYGKEKQGWISSIPWDVNKMMTKAEFELYVDLGLPVGIGGSELTGEDLAKMKVEKLVNEKR